MAAAFAILYLPRSTLQQGRCMVDSWWKDQVRIYSTQCYAVPQAEHGSDLCLAADGIRGVETPVSPS